MCEFIRTASSIRLRGGAKPKTHNTSMSSEPDASINLDGDSVKKTKIVPPKSKEFLCGLFDYNPNDGRLLRKNGKEAGSKKCRKRQGHRSTIQVCITNEDGSWNLHSAHRIIFQMMGVDVPDGMVIDHINGDPWDNRWDNLRLVTQKRNARNRGPSFNKEVNLPRCVFPTKHGGFKVQIQSEAKDTIDETVRWRDWAQNKLFQMGIYEIPKHNISTKKESGLPRCIYKSYSGGKPKYFIVRIQKSGFHSSEEAIAWRNQAEIALFGEILNRSEP